MTTRQSANRAAQPNRLLAADCLNNLLDYQLYLLYRDCSAVMERLMQTRFGITRRRWRIIAALHELSEGASLNELAQCAQLSKDQASRTVATMCREGYLKRLSNPHNARYARIVFTEKSRTLYDDIIKEYRAANLQMLQALTAAEIDTLDTALCKLRQRAQALRALD